MKVEVGRFSNDGTEMLDVSRHFLEVWDNFFNSFLRRLQHGRNKSFQDKNNAERKYLFNFANSTTTMQLVTLTAAILALSE